MVATLVELIIERQGDHLLDVIMDRESFDQIKIQLRSLGLIDKSGSGQPGIWTLTPYGEEQLFRLKALRR
jgi:hypothetical protein